MYQIEVTDTFAGEANYAWVRRHALDAPATLSQRALVRRAKALIGWTGVRCDVYDYGDMLDIRPRGAGVVCFVTYGED